MFRVEGLKEVVGRGVWVAKEGRERRRTLRERGCGVGDWAVGWAMFGFLVFFCSWWSRGGFLFSFLCSTSSVVFSGL